MNICFLILCAPPLLVFLYYMKSADVMLLCCYASDLVIKYRNFMAQEVTAHSGCEKWPKKLRHIRDAKNIRIIIFCEFYPQKRHGYAVTFAFPNSRFFCS